jgi:hypothetical protein
MREEVGKRQGLSQEELDALPPLPDFDPQWNTLYSYIVEKITRIPIEADRGSESSFHTDDNTTSRRVSSAPPSAPPTDDEEVATSQTELRMRRQSAMENVCWLVMFVFVFFIDLLR